MMDCDELFFSLEEDEELFQKIDSDLDLAFALSLQEESEEEFAQGANKAVVPVSPLSYESSSKPLSIIDPQWELIDPNPDVRNLFVQFNDQFFYGKLGSVEVKWSPRMTLCAGVCSYQGRGGLCSVRLSLPLLKLRPRRDLVETLLHEMIHAYLFVTANNKDHDAHGPEFCSHMYRINKESGTKITVYHSFHDEVDFQRKHWWKCNGPCQKKRPFYGIVKRAMNRAPGPNDTWWTQHLSSCGGTFTKIKEPDGFKQKNQKRKIQETKEQKPSANIKSFFQPHTSESDFLSSSFSAKKKRGEASVHALKSNFETESNVIPLRSSDSNASVPSGISSKNYPTPFSGKGFTLGSSSSQAPTSLLSKIRKELGCSPSQQSSFQESAKSSAVSNNNQLNEDKSSKAPKGILSHLATSPSSSPNCESNRLKQSSLDKFIKSPSRSLEKENELYDDFHVKHDQRANARNTVSCPVCFNSYPDLEINIHLDECLLAAS